MVTLWSINSWTLKMNEHHRFLEWKRIFQPRWMAESMLLEGTIFGEKNIYKPAIKGTVWVPGFWLLAICVSEWGIPQFLLIFTDVHEMMINHQIHAFGWVVAVLHASGWCLFFWWNDDIYHINNPRWYPQRQRWLEHVDTIATLPRGSTNPPRSIHFG